MDQGERETVQVKTETLQGKTETLQGKTGKRFKDRETV